MCSASRLFLLYLLIACSRNTAPSVTPDPQSRTPSTGPSIAMPAPGDTRMILSVVKNSPGNMNAVSEYCIGGLIYEGLPYRFEGINVRFPAGTSPELIEKSPGLIVMMSKKVNLASTLVKTDRTCDPKEPPMAQARSDWGTPECGQQSPCNTTLSALSAHSFWEVTTVEAYSGLSVTVSGDGRVLQVKLTNVFATKQAAQQLVAHYEGGPGKPMPHFLKIAVPELAPGATFEVQVHRTIDESDVPMTKPSRRRGYYELFYLEMDGTLPDGANGLPMRLKTSVFQLVPPARD
ncbi:MAG: hypothetical protein CVU65_13130 [Deltaproteobacteria bacterium HGW-Deltaproteobacteria-22]|nr:MAG: hypothetical protein CVU65_13130 [Deltaproteobacteria bacterium HGW-Deltaproteobacteria-22]